MNILIVEDDSMLRSWLCMLLRSLMDYQLSIYEAGDGLEALEVCRATPIELVITDIKMPRMDGLQLITRLQECHPAIRTAVLSSYDDFAFVKTALQYGALDYILKAEMTVDDLSQLLGKVQNDFHVEHMLSKGIFPDYRSIRSAQKAMADFMADPEQPREVLRQALRLPVDAPAFTVLFLHLQEQNDLDVPVFEAADICEKALFSEGLSGAAIPYQGENVLLLYAGSDSAAELQQMEAVKLTTLIENNFRRYLTLPVAFSLFRFCRRGGDLQSVIREISSCAACWQYYGTGTRCRDTCPDFPEWKARIQRELDTHRLQEAAEVLQLFLEEAHSSFLAPDILRAHLLALMNLFISLHIASKTPGADTLHMLLMDVSQAKTAQRTCLCVDNFLKEFLLALNQQKLDLSPAVRGAISYVEKHYAEKMSLDDVAEHIFINRSYFCQLFKREMGLTFGDFLEHIRIEKAKLFLSSTNLPISNVAEQAGFSSQAYFTKIFKNSTGISPLRYRKLHFRKAE